MSRITPCLWFDGKAEEAARFYVSLLAESHIDSVVPYRAETPSGGPGGTMLVEFTLAGASYIALNGGPHFTFNEAISFVIDCADQDEVDRLWDALTADGGRAVQCGWVKDRFGVSWQIVPRRLGELMKGSDTEGARRAMEAMLGMVKIDVAALELAYAGEPAVGHA